MLPWPYTNSGQFEVAHRIPLGRHWNSESQFMQIITPKIRTTIGKTIPPITVTEDVGHFIKKTAMKRQKTRANLRMK